MTPTRTPPNGLAVNRARSADITNGRGSSHDRPRAGRRVPAADQQSEPPVIGRAGARSGTVRPPGQRTAGRADRPARPDDRHPARRLDASRFDPDLRSAWGRLRPAAARFRILHRSRALSGGRRPPTRASGRGRWPRTRKHFATRLARWVSGSWCRATSGCSVRTGSASSSGPDCGRSQTCATPSTPAASWPPARSSASGAATVGVSMSASTARSPARCSRRSRPKRWRCRSRAPRCR